MGERTPRMRRLWLGGLAAISSGGLVAGDLPCQNPLFETHWFCKNDPDTLNDYPMVKTNLRLCPAYNQKTSCCHQSFEADQIQHFQFCRQIFTAKLERVSKVRAAVMDVQKTEHFSAAPKRDIDQYHRALEKFDAVLDPAAYGDCFSALISYVAGMICFSCESSWPDYVQTEEGKVIRVHIAGGVCVELWNRCKDFGQRTRELKQAMLDSRLAVLQQQSLENLEMFHDQQALCDWMHDGVAMHPFTTPGEAQREAAPAAKLIRDMEVERDGQSTLPELMSDQARRLSVKQYDSMQQGKASGFDISWSGAVYSGVGGWVAPSSRGTRVARLSLMASGLALLLVLFVNG